VLGGGEEGRREPRGVGHMNNKPKQRSKVGRYVNGK